MSWFAARPLALAIALALDLTLGDPQYRLHPVRLLGDMIATGERVLRRLPLSEQIAGVVLASATAILAVGGALALTLLAWRFGGTLGGVALEALLIYFALAGRALAEEGRAIQLRLAAGDLDGARAALSRVVGRDTADLDESQIARGAIETLGENSVDALIAPAFWALLLGAPGAWLHKAASTLDSMVGYRDRRYVHFGTASAKLDDLLALVPARLAIPMVTVAAAAIRLDWRAAWATGLRDRLEHASPNSAHGEAAFSGALRVRLGGVGHYGGVMCHRATIGAEYPAPIGSDIRGAVQLVLAVEVIMLSCAGMAALILLARIW